MPVCLYCGVSRWSANRVRGSKSKGIRVYLCAESCVADPADKLSGEYLAPDCSRNRVADGASNIVDRQEYTGDDSQICNWSARKSCHHICQDLRSCLVAA